MEDFSAFELLGRIAIAAKNDLTGPIGAAKGGKAFDAAQEGGSADMHFDLGEFRAFARDDDVAGHGNFQTGGQAEALNLCNYGKGGRGRAAGGEGGGR